MNNRIDRYNSALQDLPSSGGGGCHTALLGVATHGIIAGLNQSDIFNDLRNTVTGTRAVADSEINGAIERAMEDTVPPDQLRSGYRPAPARPASLPKTKPELTRHLIKRGVGIEEADLWEASPIRLHDEPSQDASLLIRTLYPTDAHLFLGTRFDREVRTASEWVDHIDSNGCAGLPHMIFNPLLGSEVPDKTGKPSFRCDSAVAGYWYAVAEFDNISMADQLAFWSKIPLPITALIDSGGKSIHAIIRVDDVHTTEDWARVVRDGLYRDFLIPLGVDPACANPSRLSRLPGHDREGGRMQKLLYLNPDPTTEPIFPAVSRYEN